MDLIELLLLPAAGILVTVEEVTHIAVEMARLDVSFRFFPGFFSGCGEPKYIAEAKNKKPSRRT